MAKPSLPQGTRDFGPEVVRKRTYILNTIRHYFELYGFQPLETPAMENLETLMGKYGDEGDKLIFKILNNGLDNPVKESVVRADFEKLLTGKNVSGITERALKYDLTIPFARYVAMNHGKLTLPFRRYQIQPVWRADRPQKGRYREFYQCDADIVGSNSLINETELLILYAQVFKKLGVEVEIKINHRKVLQGLAEKIGIAEKMQAITTTIDKLDKIGIQKVKDELMNAGLTPGQVNIVEEYLSPVSESKDYIDSLSRLLSGTSSAETGLLELSMLLEKVHAAGYKNISVDPTLARGLNYYTGTIIEVKARDVQIGSIAGGGRYDDLTGLFGVQGIPGVGISFGVDRIYDVMDELALFPADITAGTQVLFFNLGAEESTVAFELMMKCRENNIACEIYPEPVKFDKQFKYAEKKQIPFVVIVGAEEIKARLCVVKELSKSKQENVSFDDLVNYLK